MAGFSGMKMWLMTLVEFDENGKGAIIKSFCKPAADSDIKDRGKVKQKKDEAKNVGSTELF